MHNTVLAVQLDCTFTFHKNLALQMPTQRHPTTELHSNKLASKCVLLF